MMQEVGMNNEERRAATSLSGLYALRMLGLFMIIPVFPFYAKQLPDYTPALMGLAIGIYGLTQAIMQIPMGIMSDRWGRKRIIAIGFFLFAAGSLLAASADSLMTIVLGRALQGAGAVAAVLMALAADLSREEQRTKVMGTIGASIGLSFAFSMVLGPLLDAWIGVPGLFFLTSVLAVIGIIVLKFWVPEPKKTRFHRDAEPNRQDLRVILKDFEVLRLNAGIFILHFVLTATFVVLPLAIDEAGIDKAYHWAVYLPVIVLALVLMFPFIILAEKRRRMKQVFLSAIATLVICLGGFAFSHQHLTSLMLFLLLFFTAFNLLEASLPSLLVKTVAADKKGSAMGVYSTAQFIGTFLGGWTGGHVFGLWGISGVFMCGFIMLIVWLILAAPMKNPRYLSNYMIHIGVVNEQRARELVTKITAVRGVAEAIIEAEEGVAYLKVDRHALDTAALGEFSVVEA